MQRPRYNVINLAAYTLAAAIVYWIARGAHIHSIISACTQANMPMFAAASAFSFSVWFIGETFLFSRLFTYLHRPTTFGELIPANAASYFLQLVNMLASGGALVLFLNRRKGVGSLAAAWILMFELVIDGSVLSAMTIAAGIIWPDSPIRLGLWFAMVALCAFLAVAWLWFRGRRTTRLGRWIAERPSMEAFRTARPIDYIRLFAIRSVIFTLAGVALYFQLLAFRVQVSLASVMAFNPAVIVLGGLPITPLGMGPLQAVLVAGFARFSSKSRLLAMSLAVSGMSAAFRAPLGFTTARLFAREVVEIEEEKSIAIG